MVKIAQQDRHSFEMAALAAELRAYAPTQKFNFSKKLNFYGHDTPTM